MRCGWLPQQVRLTIDVGDTDKSRYFAITVFNNCFPLITIFLFCFVVAVVVVVVVVVVVLFHI